MKNKDYAIKQSCNINHHLLEDLKKSSHATPNNHHNICSKCYQILPLQKMNLHNCTISCKKLCWNYYWNLKYTDEIYFTKLDEIWKEASHLCSQNFTTRVIEFNFLIKEQLQETVYSNSNNNLKRWTELFIFCKYEALCQQSVQLWGLVTSW